MKKDTQIHKITKNAPTLFTYCLERFLLRLYVFGVWRWIELQIQEYY